MADRDVDVFVAICGAKGIIAGKDSSKDFLCVTFQVIGALVAIEMPPIIYCCCLKG